MTVAALVIAETHQEAVHDAAGRPAARRIVDVAWAGGAWPIVVVADDPVGALAESLAGSPARLVSPGHEGIAAAVRHGIETAVGLVGETDGLLLWPAVMTWVDPETVTSLIEAHGRQPERPLRPLHEGLEGWPVLLPLALWQPPAGVPGDADGGLGGVVSAIAGPFGGLGGVVSAIAGPFGGLDLGDPGTVLGRDIGLTDLPAYAGPPEPVGGPPPEWGAAAADEPDV